MTGDELERILLDCVLAYKNKLWLEDHYNLCQGIYFMGVRPIRDNQTAYENDILVGFLTGNGTDVMKGTCLVNAYTDDVNTASGVFYKDVVKCRELSEKLSKFASFANQHQGEVFFERREAISTHEERDIHQHFVSLKMDFKVLNQDY